MRTLYPEVPFLKEEKQVDLEWFSIPEWRERVGNVVLTFGSYDLKHILHDQYFNQIKRLYPNHTLVIGVDSDQWVRSRKGDKRPMLNFSIRADSVALNPNVGFVFEHNGDNNLAIQTIKPQAFVMSRATKEERPEDRVEDVQSLERANCDDLVILDAINPYILCGERLSTSSIIKRILEVNQPKS